MKRFKIGFLAIIAILAMSFTIASQKGALKKINPIKLTGQCVKTASNRVATDLVICSNVQWTKDITNCPGEVLPPQSANICVKQVITEQATGNVVCEGTAKFCCAVLVQDNSCVTSCPGALGWKVTEIRCKDL